MHGPLLTVAEVVTLRGRGLVVAPLVPPTVLRRPLRTTVTLRRPDGTARRVEAIFSIGTCSPPEEVGYTCLLRGIEASEVPSGTTIWLSA